MRLASAFKTAVTLLFVLGLASVCFAEGEDSNPAPIPIEIWAHINPTNGLEAKISKIIDGVWYEDESVDFGTLTYDSQDHIFRANCYYAVDVGVNSNAADWSVTHTHYSVIRTNGTETLDNNINVTFMKQFDSYNAVPLAKVSFANSDRSFSKSQLSEGWLRIYYGIASGSGDNPGVSPITKDKPSGTYHGSAVLTLTQ